MEMACRTAVGSRSAGTAPPQAGRLIFFAILALAVRAIAGCATTPGFNEASDPAPVFRTPLRLDYGGRPTVSIRIGGRGPYDFIIDTAASQSGAFGNLVRRLGLDVAEDDTSRVFSLAGVASAPTVRLVATAIGPAPRDLVAVVFDDWSADDTPQGIIGLDVFADYVVLFDPGKGELAFYDPDNAPDFARRPGWRSTVLRPDDFGVASRPLFVMEGRISRERFPMLVDTGSEITLANVEMLVDVVSNQRFHNINAPPTRLRDVLDESIRIYQLAYADLRSGMIDWGEGEMYALRTRLFEDFGYARRPFVIAGYDMFARRAVAVDFAGRRLHAGPLASSPAAGDGGRIHQD